MIIFADGTWIVGNDDRPLPAGAVMVDDDSPAAQTATLHGGAVNLIRNENCEIIGANPLPLDRRSQIYDELSALDMAAVRPLRAIVAGTATETDRQKLSEIETEVKKLRKEIGIIAEEESANG